MPVLRRILFLISWLALFTSIGIHILTLSGYWAFLDNIFPLILCLISFVLIVLFFPAILDENFHSRKLSNFGRRPWSLMPQKQRTFDIMIWIYPAFVLVLLLLTNLLAGKGILLTRYDFLKILTAAGISAFTSLALFYLYVFGKS